MIFKVLTLFPECFHSYLQASIISRAINEQRIRVDLINIRDYARNKHRKVDDAPYGGGPGMVMEVEPLYEAITDQLTPGSQLIFFDAAGKRLTQDTIIACAMYNEIILVCGHYEGMDHRIYEFFDHQVISLGDFVLTGGEIPALALIDGVARHIPGVIPDYALTEESFTDSLLEYEQYTRPEVYKGKQVPSVLLSGNHKQIEEFRLHRRLERTQKLRPDLYNRYIQQLKEEKPS